MADRWEHRIVLLDLNMGTKGIEPAWEAQLNTLGNEGWELVSIVPVQLPKLGPADFFFFATFKRLTSD